MKAESHKIDWLLDNVTQYRIAKDTGIPQSNISNIKQGKRKVENLTFKAASILTEYAESIMEQNEVKKADQ